MGELAKFKFDNVFEEGAAPKLPEKPEQDPRELPAYSEIDLEAARAEAYEQGAAVGEERARDAAGQAIAAVLDRIAGELPGLAARFDGIREDARKDAAALAFKIASKLAGELVARQPLAEVEAMIVDALSELSEQGDVPRIAVRVAEDLVDGLGAHVDGLAARAGFSGQIVLLADREMHGSNCRVEWADGGAERDVAALERVIEAAVSRFVHSRGNGAPERQTADAVEPDADRVEIATEPAPAGESSAEPADGEDAAIEDGEAGVAAEQSFDAENGEADAEPEAARAEQGSPGDIEDVGAEETE